MKKLNPNVNLRTSVKKKLAALRGQFSERFVELMRRQSLHAFYRYGPTVENAKSVNFGEEAKERWHAYLRTGNTEYLVDVATFAMCEFMFPHAKNARYEPDTRSPGLVSGPSSKELKELNEENQL